MARPTILVVDDRANMLALLAKVLTPVGRVLAAEGVTKARALLDRERIDVVVCDVRLNDGDGIDVLRHARSRNGSVPVIMMTAYATVPSAVTAMREGAFDYVTKPFDPDDMRALVVRALGDPAEPPSSDGPSDDDRLGGLLGRAPVVRELFRLVRRVAPTDATVLVLGETGTGKELVARAIHEGSARRGKPLVAVNCAAIPLALVESELFGHARGAFTGAAADRPGLFESASGSTLLLDEIGELRTSVQAKLTRVLEQRAVMRVGETRERPVDVRLVAATHRDLRAMVQAGQFREDLWFRMNVCVLCVPPLRERREDIEMLAHHFLRERGPALGASAQRLSQDATRALTAYAWPGNVRELRSAIERAAILETSREIRLEALPPDLRGLTPAEMPASDEELAQKSFREVLLIARDDASRRYVGAVLERFQGDVAAAALHAGVERESFYRLLRRHGLRAESYRATAPERRARDAGQPTDDEPRGD